MPIHLFQVTKTLTKEVAQEGIHADLMFKRVSSNKFMKEAEIQATGNPEGRQPEDKLYSLITKSFASLQQTRDTHKRGVWGHTQAVNNPDLPEPQALQRDAGPVATPAPGDKKGKKEPQLPKAKTPSIIVKEE